MPSKQTPSNNVRLPAFIHCFLLVSCFVYFSSLKMEVVFPSEYGSRILPLDQPRWWCSLRWRGVFVMNGYGCRRKLACTFANAGSDKTTKVSGNADFGRESNPRTFVYEGWMLTTTLRHSFYFRLISIILCMDYLEDLLFNSKFIETEY
jgi:hypothetical protein